MISKMEELRMALKMKGAHNFEFLSYNDFTLKIIGSFDFAYSHDIEITFFGVSFLSCTTKFNNAEIRLATKEEYNWLLDSNVINYMEDEDVIICFTLNNGGKYYIVAEKFDFNTDTVFYYKRDNLEKGQRIAEWVK